MSKDLPKVISSGSINIMGKELKFHNLNNGKRIIEEQSLYDFLEILNSNFPIEEEKIKDLAKIIKGND
jgi:hypothetical protein